jgi:hypothetical protein
LVLKEERIMKRRVFLTAGRKLKWLAPLVALVLLAGVGGAAERLLIPEELDLPFYACGLGHTADLAWVGTVFYRPLETAPGGIAVNQFVSVDPEVYPLCVEGFAVMKEGDFFPMSSSVWNRPNEVVEICFARAEEYLAALADGKVTIDELRAMSSLTVGYADFYLEVQQPADRDVPGEGFHRTVIASGLLEDGRPFFVRHARTAGAYNIDFRFGD